MIIKEACADGTFRAGPPPVPKTLDSFLMGRLSPDLPFFLGMGDDASGFRLLLKGTFALRGDKMVGGTLVLFLISEPWVRAFPPVCFCLL